MEKQRIAVVGSGRMGIGIAQVFAYAGHHVDVLDFKERTVQDEERLITESKKQILANLHTLASLGVTKQKSVKRIIERVQWHNRANIEAPLRDANVVFEAVPEVLEVKKEAFEAVCLHVPKNVTINSTTSTFLVDTLAEFVTHPQRFLNTHWLNPAYIIPVVEVSASQHADPEVVVNMIELLEDVGKMPVRCGASPGFIVPRIQALAMNEAARLAEEGVATPEEIDKASKYGFGLRFAVLGLLEFIDWGGGDILYYASNYLQEALEDDRYQAADIITQNMNQGQIGMKSGSGFFNYDKTDISEYQKETIKKFVDLLQHMELIGPAYDDQNQAN